MSNDAGCRPLDADRRNRFAQLLKIESKENLVSASSRKPVASIVMFYWHHVYVQKNSVFFNEMSRFEIGRILGFFEIG
jgi:hypothetical protein